MTDQLVRYAKFLTLTGGFVFGVIGTVWSFVFVDRSNDDLKHLTDQKAAVTREMQSLEGIAYSDFIANQQGDLIFVLSRQNDARRDITNLIYRGNLLDRATPVRNMIGALAIAKQLDYRKTYDAYERLNDDARADLTYEKFTRLKAAEKDVIALGQKRVPMLLDQQAGLDRSIAANEATRREHRTIGLASSILGSFLLLLANLSNQRKETAA